mmetsp:Transcript_11399/g.26454  ORF Transcript_11399/g.26454 Transcript_11399/m.26454 type:complete len:84 (-) Transcript_11399:50-301(-)
MFSVFELRIDVNKPVICVIENSLQWYTIKSGATSVAAAAIVVVDSTSIRNKNFPSERHITKTTKIIEPGAVNEQQTCEHRNEQ